MRKTEIAMIATFLVVGLLSAVKTSAQPGPPPPPDYYGEPPPPPGHREPPPPPDHYREHLRRTITGNISGTGSTESARRNTRNVRTTGTTAANRSMTAAKRPIKIASTPAKRAGCPMRFASDSTAPVTRPITTVTSRVMDVRRYTDSAKIESRSYTIDLSAA